MRAGIHWDSNGSHGDILLSGDLRDRVVKFVGTGRTHGGRGCLQEEGS